MYPYGHARNAECDLEGILNNKFNKYGLLALQEDNLSKLLENLSNIENLNNTQLRQLYDCDIQYSSKSIDDA
ncbi:MAG: hypothetical protein DHS20C13_30550 [Thermodesulfobacteriota bacterium]|nr:MAG: hypothetical protein DHS20C13_30550 [Thermodesulfobacteriota bacterium]